MNQNKWALNRRRVLWRLNDCRVLPGRHGFKGPRLWHHRRGQRSVSSRGLWDICYQGGQGKCCWREVEVRAAPTTPAVFASLTDASLNRVVVRPRRFTEWTIGCWRLTTWTWPIRTGSRWWRPSWTEEAPSTWWCGGGSLWEDGCWRQSTSAWSDTKVQTQNILDV